MQSRRLFLRNHRPDERRFLFGIAHLEAPGLFDQPLPEYLVDRRMNDDALDTDAALAALIERTENDPFDGILEIRILVDDDRRISAQLEHDRLLSGLRLQFPSDARRPRERE